MKNVLRSMTAVVLAVLCCAGFVVAQEKAMKMPGGVLGSYMKLSMMAENQILSLAEAVPEDKYGWRPMEGVRSMAESFMHAGSGNYLIATFTGSKLPEGMDLMKFDVSATKKADVIAAVKASFKHLRDHVATLKDEDLKKDVDFFGNPMTVGDMIVFAVAHQRESLGQEVAYARMNGIVPPWTQKRMEEAKKKEMEKKGN